MIGLCQEGKSSPDALRRSAGGHDLAVANASSDRRKTLDKDRDMATIPLPLLTQVGVRGGTWMQNELSSFELRGFLGGLLRKS
jgi:hypothetical protein